MVVGEWVRVGRIHTAALTMPVTLLGYVLAGGNDALTGLGWLLFGLGWHYFGFLQNNLFDLKYDRLDPEKQHFPLVRGAIRARDAWAVDIVGLALLFVYGAALSGFSPSPIAAMATGYAAGTIYNAYSKRTLLKPIPIAVCFSALPAIPYLGIRGPDYLIASLVAFVFTTILYQIGYSGELKDIERGERNILRALGSPTLVYLYACSLKIANIVAGVALLEQLAPKDVSSLVAVVVVAVVIIFVLERQLEDYDMWRDGRWDRRAALRNMSLMEILSYWYLVVCLMPVLGLWSVPWIVLPLLWFIALNRFIFGTTIYPKV
jgi:4-hydroxybenzoate polyprenyltransferase